MSHSCPFDPFKQARQKDGVLPVDNNGEIIPMILRHQDVRAAARDVQTYSSNTPFRVPIPSEEDVRSVRQLPIEADPPEHTEFRKIVEPFFRRPTQPEVAAQVEALIAGMIAEAAAADTVEVVRQFALPLQSRALTHLLNMPESEAEVWIQWGTHVFRDSEGGAKGNKLEDYIHAQLDRAQAQPGEDFFSALTQATYQGRPLTRDEMVGIVNLAFAGGRDTIINTISSIVAYVAEHPDTLAMVRENPRLVMTAGEEFVRAYSPLTHIGRTCPAHHSIHGVEVQPGQRVSLGWASANFDETVFDAPEEIRLDRKPNPHVGFGAGVHNCLGAPHARLIIRSLLAKLAEGLDSVELLEAAKNQPSVADYMRQVGFEKLVVRFVPRPTNQPLTHPA